MNDETEKPRTVGRSRNQCVVLVLVVIYDAVRFMHGFACKLRPPKTRCLLAGIDISRWVAQFLADISGPLSAQTRELRDQLDRASLSALLNTAEGNGRRQGR